MMHPGSTARASARRPWPRFGATSREGEVAILASVLILLVGLEIKHFLADYLLQPSWMLGGKGDVRQPGGYAHAALHAVLSGIVLLVAGAPLPVLAGLVLAEAVIHYVLDFAKVRYSHGTRIETAPRRFWALHGIDQLLHQLTYAAMIYVVVVAKGG